MSSSSSTESSIPAPYQLLEGLSNGFASRSVEFNTIQFFDTHGEDIARKSAKVQRNHKSVGEVTIATLEQMVKTKGSNLVSRIAKMDGEISKIYKDMEDFCAVYENLQHRKGALEAKVAAEDEVSRLDEQIEVLAKKQKAAKEGAKGAKEFKSSYKRKAVVLEVENQPDNNAQQQPPARPAQQQPPAQNPQARPPAQQPPARPAQQQPPAQQPPARPAQQQPPARPSAPVLAKQVLIPVVGAQSHIKGPIRLNRRPHTVEEVNQSFAQMEIDDKN